jgi:spermidine synthase
MSLLTFFFPQKINFPDSKYNKNISIFKYLNSATLIVDGLVESGDVMINIWRKGITALLPKSFKPKKVLLLGLAGGCNARLINQYFPQAAITAVEIDPFMVKMGEKYFGLKKVKNLNVVIADALDYANKLRSADQFDLVMVDCFIGKAIPRKLESVEFFKNLKAHSRFVLVNRLWWQKEKIISSKFFKLLFPNFFFIKAHTYSNVIISLV